ncbi:23S rRNA (uracil(1939)-C(5))-methyltransferase RlmD [Rubrivivax benzoatilyticus]|uniref:23S rRNA (uracil(1939)-C(5))-methyltransferase RlmD n=1 Tax=Rubrivivax benzoatilyticus TaxID=316997 RepID=A0ABX0I0B2_9BURK|nr:23S rRNA (uracil(1939)-C(5))-methyltransferase RlmD [Rubrivivax benzoatilyticus]EGJ10579.1 23S rRNA m(5)U1939 methyltransferase [Rubrivivax benzoatilyticus JA2 = ATCC BAA-35]NHK99054.1 23S rRNA (uracil(1939)-C(5))-methyltransferase RlmD [Rubrivivax benzoatilyticus]NHL25083.1 23S rRNA (uracil(1939)-C(5))-methyltransferase RlmD [Rubrivivax benzoatilyticus]
MSSGTDWLQVESLDLEAQGVAHRADGKVVFIEGALPGETVQVQVARRKNQWEQGVLSALARESSQRVRPGCPHFGLHAGACGGCKMQHLHPSAQVAVKQRVLEDNLWHLGKVKPERLLRPVHGPAWGYRWRARLSVRYVPKKGTVLVGFHERKSRYVADMLECPVLPAQVSAMLPALRELVGAMEQRDRLPQIELAAGDEVVALVLRHLEPLSAGDAARLRAFGAEHGVQWWLQPKGPETVHRLDDGGPQLSYSLPEYGVTMPFKPTDFTQVNPQINRVLVDRAVRLLDPKPHERVVDWFCGLGNFTLPLARRAAAVHGIEGSETLVQRARDNAAANGLAANTSFAARNLFEMSADELMTSGAADAWLVDPPREGAFALAKSLAELRGREGWTPPRRIVYVSCNPATLARDAGLIVHLAGFRCVAAGVVNMFPHTAHVESVAVFERTEAALGPRPEGEAQPELAGVEVAPEAG